MQRYKSFTVIGETLKQYYAHQPCQNLNSFAN